MSDNPFNFLLGEWTYRSLVNEIDVGTSPDNLLFGKGIITFVSIDLNGNLKGQLDMDNYYILNLTGSLTSAQQFLSLTMQGDGVHESPTCGWKYNYQGFFLPNKVSKFAVPNNVISGIVMRTKQHGKGKAGVSATFYMVQQEASVPLALTLRLQ